MNVKSYPHLPPRALLLEMAQRPGGFGTAELTEFDATRVGAVASAMVVKGLLYRAKMGHKSVRFFSTMEAAVEWEKGHMRRSKHTLAHRPTKAPWPKDAPATYPTNPDGSPAYKVTTAPPPVRSLRTNTY